jgi:acylglycerol lipase
MSIASSRPHPDIGVELVREWTPRDEPRANFVLIHGIAEHSGRYERTGSILAAAGFHVRSFDLIGHGGSGGPRCDIDDWGRFLRQIERHVVELRQTGRPLVLIGHSMGATLAMGYLIHGLTSPDLMVASVPTLTGGARWQRVVVPVLSRLAPTLPIAQNLKGDRLSRDPKVGEDYFADPLVYTKGTPRFGLALFKAMDEAAEKAATITIPVLALHGGSDTIVPPQSSAFLADLPGFERRLYPGLRHEILNEPEGPEVIADIIDWVNARI